MLDLRLVVYFGTSEIHKTLEQEADFQAYLMLV